MVTPTQGESLQLSVSNFGPIVQANLDLRPLTVFVGPSNTGKSYLAMLVYTLHKHFNDYIRLDSFGSGKMANILVESIKEKPPFHDANSIKQLIDWWTQVHDGSTLNNTAVQLPDFVASRLRFCFTNVSDLSRQLFGGFLVEEARRNFGIEDAIRLIRHNSSNDAEITLGITPFQYKLRLKNRIPESEFPISEEAPLYMNLLDDQTKNLQRWLPPVQILNHPEFRVNDDVVQEALSFFMGGVFSLVMDNAVSPLNNAAYYLPADRTGVMHSHQVVVASLIGRAPHAGLQDDIPLPTLSGVFADFLKQLVTIPVRKQQDKKGDLAANLEQQILKGKIYAKESEAGYPIFSYQPQGWKEDLPLMNTSSMVSELAPVILYLRHIVQPGDVLIIEEPESHLHPAMQAEFIRQLAAVVQSGIRVMLTTHSEWVLDELANLVYLSDLPKGRRKGITGADFALNPEQVGVWLFDPKQRPKGSVVKEIPFDLEYGGFRSGFDDVAIDTHNRFAEISNRIEGAK